MALIEKFKDGEVVYPYIEVMDSYKSPELKKKYLSFINRNLNFSGSPYEITNEYYEKIALFFSFIELMKPGYNTKIIKYFNANSVTFENFMEDDEVFNTSIEFLLDDEYVIKKKGSVFISSLIENKKFIEKAQIMDCSYIYNLISYVNVNSIFTVSNQFISDTATHFLYSKILDEANHNMSMELKLKYYEDYWGYIGAYGEEFGPIKTMSALNIFLFLFTEKYNNSHNNNKRTAKNISIDILKSVNIQNYDINIIMYILYTYYKTPEYFSNLMSVLESYKFDDIDDFKSFIESLDGSMPIEWVIELNENIIKIKDNDFYNVF